MSFPGLKSPSFDFGVEFFFQDQLPELFIDVSQGWWWNVGVAHRFQNHPPVGLFHIPDTDCYPGAEMSFDPGMNTRQAKGQALDIFPFKPLCRQNLPKSVFTAGEGHHRLKLLRNIDIQAMEGSGGDEVKVLQLEPDSGTQGINPG